MAEGLSRRRFIERGVALTALPTIFAACGIEGTAPTEEEAAQAQQEVSHAKERSATGRSPTGRSTWTRRCSRTSTRSSAARSATSRTSTTTTSSSGRSASSSSSGQPIGRDIVVLTDYMASRWVRNGYVEPIDKNNVPNAENLVDNLATINYDEERRVHAAVPVGRDRPRLQRQEDRSRARNGRRPLRPEVQGPRDDVLRALRLGLHGPAGRRHRLLDREHRPDPRARSRRSTRPTRTASSGASPATTTRPTWPRATS